MEKVAPYWKAFVAFLAPGLLVLVSAVLEGSVGGTEVTQAEWITAVATAFITAAGVYSVPNRPLPEPPAAQPEGPFAG